MLRDDEIRERDDFINHVIGIGFFVFVTALMIVVAAYKQCSTKETVKEGQYCNIDTCAKENKYK